MGNRFANGGAVLSPLDACRGRMTLFVLAAVVVAGAVLAGEFLFPHRTATASLSFKPAIGSTPPSANELETTRILRPLANRVGWHGSLSSLRERLSVVQSASSQSAQLIAAGATGAEALRLVDAWAVAYARYRASLVKASGGSILTDGGFEHPLGGWVVPYNGNGGEFPTLARVTFPQDVRNGRYALAVTARNSETVTRSKYVWTKQIFPVNSGERYLVRAYVSGRATSKEPISLGFRILPAMAVTQVGLESSGNGIIKTNNRNLWLMRGIYTAPEGVTGIQPALWRDGIRPGQTARFAIDDVALVPRSPRNDVVLSYGPVAVGSQASSFALAGAAGFAGGVLTLLLAAMLRPNSGEPSRSHCPMQQAN